MKKIMYFLLSTVTILVLLFGYRTSLMGPMNASDTVISSGDSDTSIAAQTFTGSATQTEWGIVQVEITVADSKITDVQVLQYPNENPKDVQINNYALPVLIDETISAQSADIQMVSGATVTSVGYVTSLQAALDEAGL
jgi:uncharacterized protein with FMN-binding domain